MYSDSTRFWKDLDWAQFEAITCGLLPEFIDVYRDFETDLPKLLEALQQAIDASSIKEISHLAHQIRGSAANFGFIGTSRAMHELERAAKARSLTPAHAKQYLASAKTAFEKAQSEVNTRLPNPKV